MTLHLRNFTFLCATDKENLLLHAGKWSNQSKSDKTYVKILWQSDLDLNVPLQLAWSTKTHKPISAKTMKSRIPNMHAQTVPILTIILPYKCILLIPVAWLELAEVSASGVKSVKCAGGKCYMYLLICIRQVIPVESDKWSTNKPAIKSMETRNSYGLFFPICTHCVQLQAQTWCLSFAVLSTRQVALKVNPPLKSRKFRMPNMPSRSVLILTVPLHFVVIHNCIPDAALYIPDYRLETCRRYYLYETGFLIYSGWVLVYGRIPMKAELVEGVVVFDWWTVLAETSVT